MIQYTPTYSSAVRVPACADVSYLIMELGQDKEFDHFSLITVLLRNDNDKESVTTQNITTKNNTALLPLHFK